MPAYRDLPQVNGVRHSWGRWGDQDRLGALNRITTEATLRGIASVSRGRVFSLVLPMQEPDPPLFGRTPHQHELTASASGALNDVVSGWNPQNSSQWDGFRHVCWPGRGHYNGLPADAHGLDHWAARPIVTRAVLVDMARWRAAVGRPLDFGRGELIEAAELDAALGASGGSVEPGDVLLVRTGWLAWYLGQDRAVRRRLAVPGGLACPGMSPREETAEFLWDLGVSAVAADNPAFEAWPQGGHLSAAQRADIAADPARRHETSLHARLLPALGIPIGELWQLDELAEDCAADGRYQMCLTSAPMRLRGAAASPANAIAVK